MTTHAAHLNLRTRLLTLEVVTTGSVTLEATATGYARPSGSFLTDGFAPGMEVVPTGFTQTDVGVIESVTALAMVITGGRDVEASGAGRTLAVGVPEQAAWDNKAVTPIAGQPWLEESFVPAVQILRTARGAQGLVQHEGLYVLRWHARADVGSAALRKAADALLALFEAGESIASDLRVRGDLGPWAGGIQRVNGEAVITITIPWRLYARNAA